MRWKFDVYLDHQEYVNIKFCVPCSTGDLSHYDLITDGDDGDLFHFHSLDNNYSTTFDSTIDSSDDFFNILCTQGYKQFIHSNMLSQISNYYRKNNTFNTNF